MKCVWFSRQPTHHTNSKCQISLCHDHEFAAHASCVRLSFKMEKERHFRSETHADHIVFLFPYELTTFFPLYKTLESPSLSAVDFLLKHSACYPDFYFGVNIIYLKVPKSNHACWIFENSLWLRISSDFGETFRRRLFFGRPREIASAQNTPGRGVLFGFSVSANERCLFFVLPVVSFTLTEDPIKTQRLGAFCAQAISLGALNSSIELHWHRIINAWNIQWWNEIFEILVFRQIKLSILSYIFFVRCDWFRIRREYNYRY